MSEYGQLRVPRRLRDGVRRRAAERGLPMVEFVRLALEAHSDREAASPSGPVSLQIRKEDWNRFRRRFPWEYVDSSHSAIARAALEAAISDPPPGGQALPGCRCPERAKAIQLRDWSLLRAPGEQAARCWRLQREAYDMKSRGLTLEKIREHQGLRSRSSALRRVRAGAKLGSSPPTPRSTESLVRCNSCGQEFVTKQPGAVNLARAEVGP